MKECSRVYWVFQLLLLVQQMAAIEDVQQMVAIEDVQQMAAIEDVQQMAAIEDDYYDDYEPDDEETAASREKRGGGGNDEYYFFITNEYSYKLWAAFMIYDIICVFYACLVSAYFKEVNTMAPSPSYDYDYLVKRSDESVIHAPPTTHS